LSNINNVFWGIFRINYDLECEGELLLFILIQPTEAH
jgi:hypothetical protein